MSSKFSLFGDDSPSEDDEGPGASHEEEIDEIASDWRTHHAPPPAPPPPVHTPPSQIAKRASSPPPAPSKPKKTKTAGVGGGAGTPQAREGFPELEKATAEVMAIAKPKKLPTRLDVLKRIISERFKQLETLGSVYYHRKQTQPVTAEAMFTELPENSACRIHSSNLGLVRVVLSTANASARRKLYSVMSTGAISAPSPLRAVILFIQAQPWFSEGPMETFEARVIAELTEFVARVDKVPKPELHKTLGIEDVLAPGGVGRTQRALPPQDDASPVEGEDDPPPPTQPRKKRGSSTTADFKDLATNLVTAHVDFIKAQTAASAQIPEMLKSLNQTLLAFYS